MNNGTAVAPRMEFIAFDKIAQYVEKFRQSIIEYVGNEVLDGMTFVLNETTMMGNPMQGCYGVKLALDAIRNNKAGKVTLLGWLPLEFIRMKKPEVDFLLSQDNFRFLQLPATPEMIIAAWQGSPDVETVNLDGIDKYANQRIGQLLHIIHGKDPRQHRDEPDVRHMVTETKKEFPSLVNATDDEIFDFLFAAAAKREEVRKGEDIPGIFCDVEGTILVDGDINQDVLTKLAGYEAQGKPVTLWTDGDVEQITSKLRELGVEYPIHAKAEYAGANVEVVIDDLDELAFIARTKVHPKTFVKVG